jgi:hypothetical protein
MRVNKRFNDLLLKLGFYKNTYYVGNKPTFSIVFDEDRAPQTQAQLKARFQNWVKVHGINTNETFKLTANLTRREIYLK